MCKSDTAAITCLTLSGIGYRNKSVIDSLPSWVPDFSAPDVILDRGFASTASVRYSAAGKTTLLLRLSDNFSQIYVDGEFFTTVKQTLTLPRLLVNMYAISKESEASFSAAFAMNDEHINALELYFEQAEDIISGYTNTKIYHKVEERKQDMTWRILIANSDNRRPVADNLLGEHYRIFRSSITAVNTQLPVSEDVDSKFEAFMSGIFQNLWWMRWFTICWSNALCQLDNGYVGIVPVGTQPGDSLFLPYGSPIPFVLRPKADKFSVIGGAYIHDIMKVEALQLKTWRKVEICLI
jgi:hypothetical protein